MFVAESVYFDIALDVLTVIMSFSLLLCFVRLYIGPNVPNRTAAFDAIALHSVGIIVLFAIRSSSTSLLDVAIVTAALGFLGTTMLAQYLERAAGRGWSLGDEPLLRPPSARVAAEVAAEDEADTDSPAASPAPMPPPPAEDAQGDRGTRGDWKE